MNEITCDDFLQALSSKAPTPGGGGAAALTGSMGSALGAMVANLTLGKKKYAAVQDEIEQLRQQCQMLQGELEQLVKADAEGFKPLAAAYRIPKTEANRAAIMQQAQEQACQVPLEIMKKSLECLELQRRLAEIGTVMAVSDVGAGVQLLRASILAASLNIYINTKSMKDQETAKRLNGAAEMMEAQGIQLADEIYQIVRRKLQ